MRTLSIKKKILLASISLILVVILIIVTMINVVKSSYSIALTLYEHPFKIINAISNITLDAQILHEKYVENSSTEDQRLKEGYEVTLKTYEEDFSKNLSIIELNFLGSPTLVEHLKYNLLQYVDELRLPTSRELHEVQLASLTDSIHEIKNFAINKASELKLDAEQQANNLYFYTILIMVLSFTYVVLVGRYLYKLLQLNELEIDRLKRRAETMDLIVEEQGYILKRVVLESPVPILIFTEEGKILMVSKMLEALSEVPFNDELTMTQWLDRINLSRYDRAKQINTAMYFDQTMHLEGEMNLKTASGAVYIWDFHSAYIGYSKEGLRLNMGVALDITERDKTMNQLSIARDEAERANVAKSRFLAVMSHEIRTPINGILGMMQLLKLTKLDDEQKEYATIAMDSSNLLLTIINDILDYSKLEANKVILERIPFNLNDEAHKVIGMMSVKANQNGNELIVDGVDERLGQVVGDPYRYSQIIMNLLSNAIKYTKNGRVVISISCLTESEQSDKIIVKTSVKDTGKGIAQDKLEKIFDSFVQEDSSTTREYGGTGLGLSIVRKLVKLMGGHVDVQSVEGVGSTFSFTVTLERERKVACLESPFQTGRENSKYDILVVEDNPTNRIFVEKALEKRGYSYLTAKTGIEAFEYYKDHVFRIVLLDIQMPGMNGFDVTEAIRKSKFFDAKSLPIVALTAFSLKADRDKCLAIGMNDYLSKPIELSALYMTVEKWLNVNVVY